MFDFFNWNKKESPLLGLQGLGGGLGYLAGGGVQLFSATGGNYTFDYSGYTYHVFTSPGNLTTVGPTNNESSDITLLVVAGGGGGSNNGGGGGGAGGVSVLPGSTLSYDEGTYAVVVGTGGGTGGGTGSNSTFSGPSGTITSTGGGGGGYTGAGGNGGSGGGGGAQPPSPGGTGVSGQGNSGGSGMNNTGGGASSSQYMGWGGGGGAGGAGGTASISWNPAGPGPAASQRWTAYNANGGAGKLVPQFPSSALSGNVPAMPSDTLSAISSGYYGGGGGGGNISGYLNINNTNSFVNNGNGGSGGGGNASRGVGPQGGVTQGARAGFAGRTHTGGGGGGGQQGSSGYPNNGFVGGSGVVMIRYITPT